MCKDYTETWGTGKYFAQAVECKVVLGSALRKLLQSSNYWKVLCASFVVQSSTGKYFAQVLQYELVLGTCKFVVQSSI